MPDYFAKPRFKLNKGLVNKVQAGIKGSAPKSYNQRHMEIMQYLPPGSAVC